MTTCVMYHTVYLLSALSCEISNTKQNNVLRTSYLKYSVRYNMQNSIKPLQVLQIRINQMQNFLEREALKKQKNNVTKKWSG